MTTTSHPETSITPISPSDRSYLAELGQQLRVDSVRSAAAAGSGHPTSSMSAADLMAVLFARHLRYDFADPAHPGNDHLIFSKGHASPLLYALYKAAGAVTYEELLTFRSYGSRLEGHPTPVLPWVDVATGSLGFGLPVGVGIALSGSRLEGAEFRTWVLCGDSEMAEGSIWEAFEHAGHEQLDRLTAIIDVNRLGQRGETMHGWDLDSYARRAEACGWHAIEVDGHDLDEIDAAYRAATSTRGAPSVIVARTRKGRGVAAVEDRDGAHGQPLPDADEAIRELGGPRDVPVRVEGPPPGGTPKRQPRTPAPRQGEPDLPDYDVGSDVATRKAYGEALAALGGYRDDVVALDGEVSNSTYAQIFRDAHPERYFEMYIAEQQMAAAAVGLSVRGWVPYASTFAAFWTRAYDFVRMAAISRAHICLVGSHAGASIGSDGPSQMGLEDLAAFRAVNGSTVLYPCDGNQTARLVAAMADVDGVAYLRTTRAATPVLYRADEPFTIGGSRLARHSEDDVVTVVAAGITVHEALDAAHRLAEHNVAIRVLDAYSIKPIDRTALATSVRATGGRLVVVEDHWPEGGLGEAVFSALAGSGVDLHPIHLAVGDMPRSGPSAEVLHAARIDADAIVDAVEGLVSRA